MFSDMNIPSAKTVVSTAASVAASAMVIRSIARDLIPYEIQYYIFFKFRSLFNSFSSEMVMIIEEQAGLGTNQIYKAAETYLGTKFSPSSQMLKVSLPEKETNISTSVANNQEILDKFNGVQLKWRQVTKMVESKKRSYSDPHSTGQSEIRYFELYFHKKNREMVLNSYLPFVVEESKNMKEEKKTLKIYTLSNDRYRHYPGDSSWSSINLDHPATFDTLAMETELKRMVMDDLQMFVRRKDFYRRVGKAWKRGYLMYGPPGTGKSSLIAAMANYLKFDIYDLELTDIRTNSDLRRLLIATGNRSILVVEDIDCSLELEDREAEKQALNKILQSSAANQAQTINIVRKQKNSEVTLSGLLNFIDGLWSSCGDERIIVFTTNHKDRLDLSLLRPGRMVVHIHMSYCSSCGFKTLATNYLGISDHSYFPEIEQLLENAMATPAEVAEQLLKNEEPEIALRGLIEFLKNKKRENDEMKSTKLKEEHDTGEQKTEDAT